MLEILAILNVLGVVVLIVLVTIWRVRAIVAPEPAVTPELLVAVPPLPAAPMSVRAPIADPPRPALYTRLRFIDEQNEPCGVATIVGRNRRPTMQAVVGGCERSFVASHCDEDGTWVYRITPG